MDIFVSVLIGMFVGAIIAVSICAALAAYHAYQREVSARFNAAKKEIEKLKKKQHDLDDRLKIAESTMLEQATERRNDNEGY